MKFNINDKVRVKLTQKGKDILCESHYKFLEKYGGQLSEKSKEFNLPVEDENGFSEWQMWVLFQEFGAHIFMGCEPPFSLDIEIPITDKNRQ